MAVNHSEEVIRFNNHLYIDNEILCDNIDDSKEVCERLSKLYISPYVGELVKINRSKKLFLNSVSNLGESTKDFYKRRVSKVKISKASFFPNGEQIDNGEAMLLATKSKPTILISKSRQTTSRDLIAIFHEFGHLPTLLNGSNKDYYEYEEVLPIYFEYLACKQINSEKAKELLLQIRLEVSSYLAQNYMWFNRLSCNDDHSKIVDINNKKRECFKYIKSLEYVLQLIDVEDEDKSIVNDSIDRIVRNETSFRELESSLGIDTYGSKKILSRI